MGQPKSQVTEDIISVAQDFAETQECRQLYSHINDDNSRAYYTALAPYKGKYKKLIEDFPDLANDYNNNKLIKSQYSRYFGTALNNLAELAEESDPSFVRQAPSTPAPRRQRATTRTAPTTVPTTVSSTPAPASSAEVILLAQSVNTLGKTFADRDAKYQKEQADRDAAYRKEQAERDAKKAEEDKENRQEMLQIRKDMADRDEKRAEENKSTRDMAAFAIAEVATAKKDIATAKKERDEIRQYIGMDDVPANLFQDDDSVVAADDLEVPFEENLEDKNEPVETTTNFEIEDEDELDAPPKNYDADNLAVPIEEENLEVENATATEQPATPSKNDDAPKNSSPKKTSSKKTIFWTVTAVGIFAGIYFLPPQVQEDIKKVFSAAVKIFSAAAYYLSLVLENTDIQQMQDMVSLSDEAVAVKEAVVAVKEAVVTYFLALVNPVVTYLHALVNRY